MKKKRRSKKLSAGELRLMGLLWEKGSLTLSEAHQSQTGDLGYTTIQTQLNRLVDKGVASRTKSRPMKYRALVNPIDAGEGLLQLLIDTVGGGSVIPLIAQLIALIPLTHQTARELKQLIHESVPVPPKLERRRRKRPPKKR